MSVKPVTIASVLGTANNPPNLNNNPSQQGNRLPNSNRFSILRDRSNSPGSFPLLSPAAKRPLEGVLQPEAVGKNPRLDSNLIFKVMEDAEHRLKKGKDSVVSLKCKLVECTGLDNSLKELLGGMVDTMDMVLGVVESFSSAVVDKEAIRAIVPQRSRANSSRKIQGIVIEGTTAAAKSVAAPLSAEEVKKRKFVSAVREAEKSVLVFKLDLGSVPIMNTGTISRKVTESITAKAAVAEGKTNGRPSEDVVTVLEDTLSMMKGMEFFGKVTKPYRNSLNAQDPDNGKFCRLPVKMNFKDKDAKIRAETVLRGNCKLQCSTPYPIKLRQSIRLVLKSQMEAHPKEFVQVRVDPENLTLRISRKVDGKWFNNIETVPLGTDVLELGTVSNTDEQMEVVTAVVGAGSL